jgi:hypothetical protein
VAVILRLIHRFHPSKKEQFLELEKEFAALEDRGVLPKGERMMPIAAREPANTFVWQRRFENLSAAEATLKLFDTSSEHAELAKKQLPCFTDAWVELYEVLDFSS